MSLKKEYTHRTFTYKNRLACLHHLASSIVCECNLLFVIGAGIFSKKQNEKNQSRSFEHLHSLKCNKKICIEVKAKYPCDTEQLDIISIINIRSI